MFFSEDIAHLARSWRRWFFAGVLLCAGAGLVTGAESRPVVGPGATRDEVIAAYGWPNGQSQSGAREILTYAQGQVTLVNGRVEQVDFSPNKEWPAPKPRPAEPTAVKARPGMPGEKAMPPVDYWGTDFDAAVREATARRARILVLFSGSDWSPPSKRFHDEVEFTSDFVNAVLGYFVLLRLDYPAHASQPPELRAQNARLRARFGVTIYPTLLVLSPAGAQVAIVDLAKVNPAGPYREQVVSAITEVRKLLAPSPRLPKPAEATGAASATFFEPPEEGYNPWLLLGAVAVLAFLWWLLRRGSFEEESEPEPRSVVRQLPTPVEVAGWSQVRLREVCVAVFEVEGYLAKLRPPESGAELALHRGSEDKPEILVHCRSGTVGLAGPRVVRELFGTVIAEGVATGWVVSPGGFTAEARKIAAEHGMLLIGGEELLQRLAEVPPLALLEVLAKSG